MKSILIVAMFFAGFVCIFGIDNNGSAISDTQPVITGGWHEIDSSELDEEMAGFVENYLDENILNAFAVFEETACVVERVWTQLVHGRRYLFAYSIMLRVTDEDGSLTEVFPPVPGLLMVYRDHSGDITLEKDFSHSALFDFIEFLLIN